MKGIDINTRGEVTLDPFDVAILKHILTAARERLLPEVDEENEMSGDPTDPDWTPTPADCAPEFVNEFLWAIECHEVKAANPDWTVRMVMAEVRNRLWKEAPPAYSTPAPPRS